MTFKTINLEEYRRLLKNKKKMFDMTFPTPESVNKYRDDDKINQKILNDEQIDKQNKNLSEMFDKNLDKNLNKYFNEKTDNIKIKNIPDQSNDNISTENIPDQSNDNISTDSIDIDDRFDNFKFITDEDILSSFDKVFKDYNIIYTPNVKSTNINVKYLLRKLNDNKNVPRDIFNYFDTNLSNLKFKNKKIPIENIDSRLMIKKKGIKQFGEGNIKIKDLDKGILRIRYLNNRKLTNKLLKDDYRISKRMVNAIKFNKDIHKLSNNEKTIYYELQKFLNKEQDINVLIGSYLSGNDSKSLYNKINKMLYNKLKNNLISKKEYSSLLNKINKSY